MEVQGRITDGAGVNAVGRLRPMRSGDGVEFVADSLPGARRSVKGTWSSVARFIYRPRTRGRDDGPDRWLVLERSEALAFQPTSLCLDEIDWLREATDLGTVRRWPGPPLRRQVVGWFLAPFVAAPLMIFWIIGMEGLEVVDVERPLSRLVALAPLPLIVAAFGVIDRRLLQRRAR